MEEKLSETVKKQLVWDCGSSLYDSFELKSFKQQLDSALSARSLSMPHLSDRRVIDPVSDRSQPFPKKSSRIARSIQKLIRSVFKPKQSNSNNSNSISQEGFYVVCNDRSAVLSTIPEVPEYDFHLSPEISSLVRRTASDRFNIPASVGISCA